MLSSRAKIRMALVSVALISMAAAAVSLLYMTRMVKRVDAIVERDAKMAELGEDISVKILEARREEKNFIIYLDSTYVRNSRRILAELGEEIEKAKEPGTQYPSELDSIEQYLARYELDVGLLVKTFQEDPKALETLQKQLMSYEDELKRLAETGKIDTDSLLPWMSGLGVYSLSAITRLSAEKAALITDLRESSMGVQRLAQAMVGRARESLRENGDEAVRYGKRAQRNAITFFLLTGLLLVYLVVYLPNRIFLPLRKILRTLKAISRGEAGFPFPDLETKDELGELSRAFENALRELRTYNILKTNKIVDSGKRLRRILEEMDEPVIFVSPELKIEHMNGPARVLFPSTDDTFSREIQDLPDLWGLVGGKLEETARTGRVEFSTRSRKKNLKNRAVSITPYFDRSGKLEMTVIIIKSSADDSQ